MAIQNFCWENCNIGASDERKKKKKKEMGRSGVNSRIDNYIFLKLFVYNFINNFFYFINTIEKMYMNLKKYLNITKRDQKKVT